LDFLLENGVLLKPYATRVNFLSDVLSADRMRDYDNEKTTKLKTEDIRYFLEKGADPNVFTNASSSSYFQNAFIPLVEYEDGEFLDLVLGVIENSMLNHFNNYGSSPLTTAIHRGKAHIIKKIFDHGVAWKAKHKPKSAIQLLLQDNKIYIALKLLFDNEN
jgi:hypothetical protein